MRRGNYIEKGYRISFVNHITTAGFDNSGVEKIEAEITHPGYLWDYIRINQIRLSTYRGYDYIKVKYKREIPEHRIAQEANLSRKIPQISYLEFPNEKAILNIKSMTYQDPYICIFNGYWTYSSRVPEWLPQNYRPG